MASRIHSHVVRLAELTIATSRTIADGSEDVAVPVDLEHLAVLTCSHPQLLVRVHVEPTNEISGLNRLDELTRAVVDYNPILFAIADVHISIARIYSDRMSHTEMSRPRTVPEPLADKFAVLIQMKYASCTTAIAR